MSILSTGTTSGDKGDNMRDRAIRITHPMAVAISNETEAWDAHGNPVPLDENIITDVVLKLQSEYTDYYPKGQP